MILHQETSQPGRVGNALRALGHELDVQAANTATPCPKRWIEHAGAVIFGGPMSANDGDDYVRREVDWIGWFASSVRFSAFAGRSDARGSSAPGSRRIRKAAPRSAITQ